MSDRKNTEKAIFDLLGRLNELEDFSRSLGRINDRFPATRAFLEMRGVASVNDLDAQGRADLKAYLETKLKLVLAGQKEPTQA